MNPRTRQTRPDRCHIRPVRRRGQWRRGFTLIEMVAGTAIAAIIMVGITSAVLIATRVLPGPESPADVAISAGTAAEQLATELQYAISIVSRSSKKIEFTVADRSGDAAPETICYEWSAAAGAPLTRKYNAAAAVNIIDKVYELNLSYDIETVSKQVIPPVEGSEVLLSSYNSTDNLADYPIRETEWYGQYFMPSLSADAISWRVTRVQFFAKQAGPATGQSKVQLQLPTVGKVPSSAVQQELTLWESTLPVGYAKVEFSFSTVSNLSPTQGLCLVLKWISGDESCRIWGRNSGVSTPNGFLVKSTNRGTSWSTFADQSLLFWVYGKVTTPGQPQTQTTYYLRAAEVKLRAGSDTQSTVCTRTRILSRPEVTP